MLHIWTIHITYFDDWSYMSGRFAIRITTIAVIGLRINGIWVDWNGMPWHNVMWKGMLLCIIIEHSNRTAEHFIAININSCYFWTIKSLHIWTIRVTYLDNWGYIPGRFVPICTMVMAGLRISRPLDISKRHVMACKGMLLHINIHNINSQHNTVQHIYIYSYSFSIRYSLLIWPIQVTYLDDWGYISGRFELGISTIVIVGSRINGQFDGAKWHAMPWYGLRTHVIVHYYTKY